MSVRRSAALLVAAAVAAGGGLAGCGLKGTLSLPEKSGNVVIRSQSTAAGATTQTAEGASAPTTETKVPPAPEKLPPPELPHSNTGTPR